MKLQNIHGFKNIDCYVKYKLEKFSREEKSFESLFHYMFDESDNVMIETSDGYRVTKTTYGAFKKRILDITPTVRQALKDVPQGEYVGLYMSNCVEWLQIFWAILASGYTPLIMNTRLPDLVLEDILTDYSVRCVISDGKRFSVNTLAKEEVTVVADTPYTPGAFGSEVIFMSSGTSDNVKLCAYSGENFYYQLCDSVNIIEQCPGIKKHYDGELKQLVLLPLCHVFGFIAVYLWFGFFSRTFVFPRDLNPDTVQRTVKKHKVTHIFAVPMVWEAVHKAAMNKIKSRGESTLRSFRRVSNFVNRHGKIGDLAARKLLREVREGLFGDSIQFLITGGSHINPETLRFFNGIGYHLANGYGMTEIGITSVEKSSKRKTVNSGSIGAPFGYTHYSIDSEGRLLVGGKTRASRIMQKGKVETTSGNDWFCTGDLMRCEGGRYYARGRADDLIITVDGENLNPQLAESQLVTTGAERIIIYSDEKGKVTLLAYVPGIFSEDTLRSVYEGLTRAVSAAKLDKTVNKILFTHESPMGAGEFKISRKKIATRVSSGTLSVFDPANIEEHISTLYEGMEAEIAACFAEALEKDVSAIGRDSNFFRELEGTSLDYFALLGIIKNRLGVEIPMTDGARLATVREIAEYVKNRQPTKL